MRSGYRFSSKAAIATPNPERVCRCPGPGPVPLDASWFRFYGARKEESPHCDLDCHHERRHGHDISTDRHVAVEAAVSGAVGCRRAGAGSAVRDWQQGATEPKAGTRSAGLCKTQEQTWKPLLSMQSGNDASG
jgi:hypothetical protein